MTDERIALVGQPIRSVLLLAFRAKDYHFDAPTWAQSVQVDIQAILPRGATRQHVPEMLQALLVQRFGLAFHREARLMQVYELVVDETGTRMEEAAPLNELDRGFPRDPRLSANADRVTETLDGPVRTIMGDMGRTTITSQSLYQVKLTGGQTYLLNASRMSMADLASLLETVTGQPVLDRTNLTALYRFTVELPPIDWVREAIVRRAADPSTLGPSLSVPPMVLASEAVKGLGLRLERRRAQIETIVVDKLERSPTEN